MYKRQALDEGERKEFITDRDERGAFVIPLPDINDPAMALPRITPRPGGPYPVDTRTQLIERLEFYGSVKSAAYGFNTSDGNDQDLPTLDSTAKKGVRMSEVALNTPPGRMTQDDNPQFSQTRYYAHEYTSKPTAITRSALRDSKINLNTCLLYTSPSPRD